MIKKQSLVVFLLLCASYMGFGQTKIAELTFEATGVYTTSISEFTDGAEDYFTRTDGTNIAAAINFTNIQGNYYFAAQDIDGGVPSSSQTLSFSGIDISSYTNLELRVHLAEDDDGSNEDWDLNNDYIHVTGIIDGGASLDLIWVENDGSTFNSAPYIDSNYDGIGDGAEITDIFTQFTQTIAGIGSLLDIQIEFNLDSGDEDFAIDNIEIWGVFSGGGCNISSSGLANITCNDNGTIPNPADDFITFDLNPTGSTLGATYSVSVSSGTITPNSGISYGSATTFTLQNGSAGAGDVTVTIEDVDDNTCTLNQLITDPGDCAVPCSISASGLLNTACNDNSTPANVVDDFITFDLNPTGLTLGATYSVTISSGTITPNSGISYGIATTFTLQNGSAGADNVTVTITDVDDSGCTLDQVITDPGSCNSGNCIELFISEYHEAASGDEKYIEIYNPTASTIDLSNYQLVQYNNGSVTPTYTLALSGNLASYSTYIVANNSGSLCPGADLCTAGNIMSFNGNDVMALQTSGGSNIDVIGVIGDSSNFAINVDLRRKSTIQVPTTTYTASEWDSTPANNVLNLGLHTNDCQGPTPEIQITDDLDVNQNCGAYSIDFGAQANTTNTDIDIKIKNVGSATLTINSLNITGSANFTLVSPPATPFDIAPSGSQTITVRFTPTIPDGTKNATLTINNTDSNEGTCAVNLTGEGYTPTPEINVEGNLGTFPDIDGDASNTPAGFDNTLFPTTPILSSVTKSFRIENLGTADLSIGAISFSGAGAGDFSVSVAPSSPVTSGNFTTFDIQFTPTVLGSRVAVVNIVNTDLNENPYQFNIEGTGSCSASHSITSFAPTSGPIGTEVTIVGTGFSAGSSVSFNGGNATIISQTATELIVEVPTDATTGIITVTENSCDLESSSSFTKTNTAGGCTLSELIMTEIYDATSFSLGYIEIYNGTGSTIDLTNYYIRRYGNSTDFVDDVYTDYTFSPSLTSINNDTVLYGKISTSPDTAFPNFDYTPIGGFAGINGEDIFHLYNGSTLIDVYIVTEVNTGYVARRNINTTGPNTVSNPSDWNISGTENESDLGLFPFVLRDNPSVTAQPIDVDCDAQAEFSVQATSGEGGTLTYQWHYNDGVSSNWDTVDVGDFPLATISGETSDTFTILTGFYYYVDYQFYCLVTEDAGCNSASHAAQIDIETTTWTSSGWVPSAPDIDTIVYIDYDYTTNATNGSFDACNLIINAGNQLSIENGYYVKVQNNVSVYGDIIVRPSGAFVQVDDSGTFTLDPNGTAKVEKETAPANQWYEYTYWSSPVENETIENALSFSAADRRFLFDAQGYRDSVKENGNSNSYQSGHDDVDDPASEMDGTGTDWKPASGLMDIGIGYASTHSLIGFNSIPCNGGSNCQFKYTFEGPFNTRTVTVPIYRNDDEMADNNWNFLGNPYPSAINADLFLDVNAINDSVDEFSPRGATEGAIFFWSQDSPPSNGNTGNQNQNFAQDDYAIINKMTETPGGDGVTPDRTIPSGQGFFISYADVPVDANNVEISASPNIIEGTVTFTNSMRVTGFNDKFFRSDISKNESTSKNILKLNLTTDNGVFNQMAIGYVEEATNEEDGMGYDTPRNFSSDLFSTIYTLIENADTKFAIQGKASRSLTLEEVIPIGFDTTIDVATLYTLSISQIEGEFLNNNTIYLKDNLMNIIHDLSNSDYTFTSEVGEFKARFEIVFNNASLTTNDDVLEENTVSIIELDSSNVKFKTSTNQTIQQVKIFDVLGRLLFDLKGNSHSEIYNLSNLSQSTYIAKIMLSNGVVLTKKAVKRK